MFYPEAIVSPLRRNCATTEVGSAVRQRIEEAARPWRDLSDEALWDLVFGPRITRSWMVWYRRR